MTKINLEKFSHSHGYDPDTDRCKCGSEIVYHEDIGTHGCEEVAWFRNGLPVDGFGKVREQ